MRKPEEIKKQIKEYEDLLKTEGLLADEKKFMEDELKELREELKKAEEVSEKKPSAKKMDSVKKTKEAFGFSDAEWNDLSSKEKEDLRIQSYENLQEGKGARKTVKKAPIKKTPPKKKSPLKKAKSFIIFEGKKIFEDDANYCEKLVQAWKSRKAKAKKAAGKRKTKPVTQKVAADVAQAIGKGIGSMGAQDIKKNPEAAITKIERLEKKGTEFLEAFKDVLGEKITKKEIAEEFDGIKEMIDNIKKKYINKK